MVLFPELNGLAEVGSRLRLGDPIVEGNAVPVAGGSPPEYNWPHGIGEVVSALIGAGLCIEWAARASAHAYPYPTFLEKGPDREYGWPGGREDVPLTFSVGARREGR